MNFEQLTVGKGGVVGVFGSCQNEIKWGTIMADFLLRKMLLSKRYDYVNCLNLDRKNTDINNLSKRTDPTCKKLRVAERKSLLDSSGRLSSELILDACKLQGTLSPSCTYGVVIYSFSELLLSMGWQKASNVLREILTIGESRVDETGQTAVPSSSSMNRDRPCIILVINESVHTPLVLAQIQRFLFTFARAIPNVGTLAIEVVCEIQTIRKSSVTGKVAEGIDMFSYSQNYLQLIEPVDLSARSRSKVDDNDDPADGSSQKKSPTSLLMQEMDKNLITSDQEGSKSFATAGPVQVMQRLITFENTDPEFDEDSDPDADLDL